MKRLPTLLTLLRLPLTIIVAGLLFGADNPAQAWLALVVFIFAALTDLLDGYLARLWDAVTELGRVLDSTFDKLLTVIPLIALAASQPLSGVVVGCIVLITARELLLSGLRESLAGLGLRGVIATTAIGKVKMHTQVLGLCGLILSFAIPSVPILGAIATGLMVLATLVTWISGADYLLRAWRVLAQNPAR